APEDPDLVRTAGHLEASRGRLDRAERAYRLAARRTRSAAPWLDLGNVLLGGGRLDEALAAIDDAARRDVADSSNVRERGAILAALGRLDEAEHDLEAARALAPGDFRTVELLAEVHARRGDYARAEALLDAMSGLGADEEGLRLLDLAKVRAYRGDPSARETLRRAVAG